MYGIDYIYPEVSLLHTSPLVNAEIAGRTAYDSFKHSEHEQVQNFISEPVEDIDSSELMNQLCHVYFHDSVMEHINLTFNIVGISRGILQELVRHRIASYTVRSTRYTMTPIICALIASSYNKNSFDFFSEKIQDLHMFTVATWDIVLPEIESMYYKLLCHASILGKDNLYRLLLSKEQLEYVSQLDNTKVSSSIVYKALMTMKTKRNAGDPIKHIVTDNWKTDLVMTINLRSLKNLLKLRDSNAAYFQIQVLAQEMKKVIPKRYLSLIVKS